MHDYGPLHSIVGLNKSQSLYGQEFLTQKAPDKSLGTNMRHESVSPHSVAGPRQLVPLNIAQSDYEQALGPKKGSDTSLGAQTRTGPHVPSHSEDESSHLILINTAQNVYEQELNVIDNLLEILAIQSNSLMLEDKVPLAKLCHILSTLCLATFPILSVFCGNAFDSLLQYCIKAMYAN